MTNNNSKTRRYCFTVNNYTQKDLKRFHSLALCLDKHRYICYGLEIAPSTGTKHIQGYIELNEAQRFSFLQNYFHFTRNGKLNKFHIEPANGTAQQNKKYVSKDNDFYEHGQPMTQGSRTDLRDIKDAVKENPKLVNKIIDEYGNNLQQVKFAQALQPIYFNHRNPGDPPKVFWIFGMSGVGKTKLVYDTFKEVCSVSSFKWPGTDYLQQECYLLDDFRSDDMPFATILKIADRYPFTLEYKGGQVPLNSPFIIFTSPDPIEKEFSYEQENLKQLTRRITQICLDNIEDIGEVDLRDLDDKFIYKHGANNSHPF